MSEVFLLPLELISFESELKVKQTQIISVLKRKSLVLSAHYLLA